MIEKNSKVNSMDYELFCKALSLDFTEEYPIIDMNFERIESSFKTKEPIFDYFSIKEEFLKKVFKNSNISIKFNTEINSEKQLEKYDVIINSTYSEINHIKDIFKLKNEKLKFQDVVIPIFEFKNPRVGLTIMDGNFCSVLPQGKINNKFLLYHVKFSILEEIMDYSFTTVKIDTEKIQKYVDNIYAQSSLYFNFLNRVKNISYYRTIRAIPVNFDDSRLSEIKVDYYGNKKVISILSGKISTCFLIADQVNQLI
jgi:hypothetical protein